jgi:ATP-dependent RNA helicase DDX21
MLKMGFKDDVDKILKFLQSKSKSPHQTLLFSATLPEWIMSLSKKYLKPNHKVINMIPLSENSCSTTIKHYKMEISKRNRASVIRDLIQEFVPKQGLCIIFCETKRETTILQDELSKAIKERI